MKLGPSRTLRAAPPLTLEQIHKTVAFARKKGWIRNLTDEEIRARAPKVESHKRKTSVLAKLGIS